MNAGAVKVDAMGFAQAAKAIGREISDRVVDVAVGVRKAHATLNTLKFRMEHNTAGWTADDIDEISDLVDMALMMLPHHYADLNDPVDLELRKLNIETEKFKGEADILATLLNAMTIAAQRCPLLSELQEQATKVYEIARKHPAHEADWQTFRTTIEARGFVVKPNVVGVIDLGPSVLTPDMLPKRKKVQRKVDELVGSLHEIEAAGGAAPARRKAKGACHA